jgi:tetratricopeptide (TPR) repeat protein
MQPDAAIQQDPNARLKRVEGYLESDPGNLELLGMAIDLSLAAGDAERAAAHARAARERHPANPFIDYRHGRTLIAQGRWREAAPLFAALLTAHPHVNVAYSLADCQLRAGDYAAALQTLAPFHANPALPPEAVTLMLRALHHLGNVEGATALAEAQGARMADDTDFLAAASLLHLDNGQVEQAAALAERVLASGQRPVEALVTSGTVALARTDTDLAIERFNEVLAKNPSEGRSWSGLGTASLLCQDLANARTQLEQAVRLMPTHIGSWHALGWCQLFARDLVGAEQSFSTALGLDRNFGESHGAMAVIAAHNGERAAAKEAVERALRLDPTCLSARYAQMVMNGQTEDPERFKPIAYRFLAGRKTLSGEAVADVVERMLGPRG